MIIAQNKQKRNRNQKNLVHFETGKKRLVLPMNSAALSWLAIIVFVGIILVGIRKKINLGILAIGAAFLLGFLVDTGNGAMSSAALKGAPITSQFPFNIFWLTVSVSLMLNVGTGNGTFDVIVKRLVGLARGRRAIIPILIFFTMFVICSVGAGSTGIVVLLCTIAATIAKDQDIDPVFMLLSVLSGATVAIGSPVAVIGIVCNSLSEQIWGEQIAPGYMYPRAMLMATLTFAVIYILFKGWKLKRWPVEKNGEKQKLNRKQIITLIGYGVFIVLAIVLKLDMGLSAFLVTAVLLLLQCADEKTVIADVPWSSVLLICGMCMMIGVVNQAGGMDLMTDLLGKLMNHYTVKPIYSIIGSILSMVSSVTGVVLPTMIPTIPDIAAKTGVNPYALVTALAYGGNITCVSPISSMGAIAMGIMSANPQWDSNELFKKMMKYSFIVMGVAAVWAAIGIS